MARPPGSVAAVHKIRRDYRFGQKTMQQIKDGIAVFGGSLKETAFVERAISHYSAFLAGNPEALAPLSQEIMWLQEQVRRPRSDQHTSEAVVQETAQLRAQLQIAEQERDQTQEKNHELDRQLRQTRASVRELERTLRQAKATTQQPAEKKLDPSKAYQIKIRHDPQKPRPALPEGLTYDESEWTGGSHEKQWNAHHSPVHTVLNQHWPIARVREKVEQLKSVPGLLRIWIEKNGEPVKKGGVGYATDMWVKREGRWVKD